MVNGDLVGDGLLMEHGFVKVWSSNWFYVWLLKIFVA